MPYLCDVCEDEELVLTAEQNNGVCQSCASRANELMIPVEDLCRSCHREEGCDPDGTGRPLCGRCRAEADADHAEFMTDLANDR